MPSFQRRRASTPSISTHVPTVATSLSALISTVATSATAHILVVATSSPPLVFLVDEDDKLLPSDWDLPPHKRRSVDVGGGVPSDVDVVEEKFTLRETEIIYIGDDIGSSLEAPYTVEVNEGMPLHSEGVMVAFDNGSMPMGQGEASSSRMAIDVSLTSGDKGKDITDEGDDSSSDMDRRGAQPD